MQTKFEKLTSLEKIGQMFIVGLDGTEAEGDIIELIQTYKIGGVILSKRNFESVEQINRLINGLKMANAGNDVPLFIAIDHETGRGDKLPSDIRKLPALRYICENSNLDVVNDAQKVTADTLKKLGFNMNVGLLLDMGGMVKGNMLGDRCISTNNTTTVSEYGVGTLSAYREMEIVAVPKYFPGHTSSKGDTSNIIIPYTKKSLAKLEQFDLVPFKHVIEKGAETMLVGNINLSRLNMFAPATMSTRVVTKLLKGRYNFEGISIADDLCSTCIKVQYGIRDAAYNAIKAGNDMIIVSDASKAKQALHYVERQRYNGKLDEKAINDSAKKIIELKAKYKLNDDEVPLIDINEQNLKIEEVISKIREIG